MTPQQRHQDAVDYVKQWRDEERARYADAERTSIIWPGGPYDFVLVEARETGAGFLPAPWKGWTYITGKVIEPDEPQWGWHTFYCRPVNNGYEMIPKRG